MVRPQYAGGWCEERLVDRIDECQQLFRAVDPVGDFTESQIARSDMALNDVLQSVEADRVDRCMCYRKRHPPKGRSTDLDLGDENESGLIDVWYQGVRYQYWRWAQCPTFKLVARKRKWEDNSV